jgi:hypothetical protein
MRRSFFNTCGVNDRGTAKTSAMARMQIQPRTRGVASHHSAEDQLCVPLVALKGDSYRLKDRDLGRVPAAATEEP